MTEGNIVLPEFGATTYAIPGTILHNTDRCEPTYHAPYIWRILAHLDGFAGQLEESSRDGHHPGVLRVKRSQECHRIAAEVLLVVDEALGEEGDIALVEVVDDSALAAVLLHERYPQLVALDRVEHLQVRRSGIAAWSA